MEFLKAFYPIILFAVFIGVLMWVGLAWYFGMSWV